MQGRILILDFGGQYNQLIARRVRECRVYCELHPYTMPLDAIRAFGPSGIIFTGGPNSVYLETSPHYDPSLLGMGIPVLGICYGDQLLSWMAGGTVESAGVSSEYGKTELMLDHPSGDAEALFDSVPDISTVWMSHTDHVDTLPPGFVNLAHTSSCPSAAMGDPSRKLYGVQFHPEVTHTEYGNTVLSNFLFKVAGLKADWKMDDFIESSVEKYRKELKGKKGSSRSVRRR